MITFLCSHCGVSLRVPPDKAGVSKKCPRCGSQVEAPSDSNTGSGPIQAGTQNSTKEGRGTFEVAGSEGEELELLGPPREPDELGRLGNYRVLKVLGSGGMGVVFQAEDLRLKRLVALKVMKKVAAANQINRERFLREAQAAASIEHDHVVPVYEVNEDRGVPFLAMKLLQGESLEDRLNHTGIQPLEETLRIGIEIAEGLAAAHQRGHIHRDIKPANIWLEEGKDRVRIVDFGLARSANEDAKLTQENFLVGTPMYMSPEQASGDRVIDHRTDLFSLGSVLYRMSTGELPFKGKTTLNVLTSLVTKKPRNPKDLNPDLPSVFADLVLQLLQKKPDDRPSSAREVVSRLTSILESPHQEEEPETDLDDSAEIVQAEPDVEVTEAPRPRPRPLRRRRAAPKRYTDEEILARKVIRFAIFMGVCVFLLLTYLVIKNTYFRKTDDGPNPPKPPAPTASP